MARRKKEKYEEQPDDYQEVTKGLLAAQNADYDIRQLSRQCVLFCIDQNGQWEPYWWNANNNKPRYTVDLTSPIIDQIMASIEQANFDVRISPAGGDATKETALIYEGLMRNIENLSGAADIYVNACRQAVMGGFSAWRLENKYVSNDSFDQDIVISAIPNALDRVWFDPNSQRQDRTDAEWCVILHAVGKDEYKERWPDGAMSNVGEGRQSNAYYYKPDVVIIGEYLYLKETPDQLVLMSNGATYAASELDKVKDDLARLGITEVKRRKTERKIACSRMFDGSNWLQEAEETAFNMLPVVPLYINFNLFEDKTIYYGHVMRMMDPQRILNYSLSREIEEGALAPRPKYWMTTKQAEGHHAKLSTMNTNADPVQFYTNDPDVPGPPQQQGGAKINEGLRVITESMRQVIGQVGGRFAASMGDNPGLQSGVAIEQLQDKGDDGTIKFSRAMESSIGLTGKIAVPAIPKVYDTRRQKRLMYSDGQSEVKTLNDEFIDMATGQVITMNDLSKGQYDVICKASPSFRSQQEETTKIMLELAKVDPELFQIGGDLFLKNLSTPVSDQLAERKRAQMIKAGMIPESRLTKEEKAQIQQDKQQNQQQQDPNMVLAQAEMLIAQAKMQDSQNRQMELQLKAQELQLKAQDISSGNAIDGFKAQTDRMNVESQVQERGAKAHVESIDAVGKHLANIEKGQRLSIPPHLRPTNGRH